MKFPSPLSGSSSTSLAAWNAAKAEALEEFSTQALATASCPRYQVRTNATSLSTRSLMSL